MDKDLLNQPLHLPNGAVLRNRLAKAAMSETLGTYDNRPTPELVQLGDPEPVGVHDHHRSGDIAEGDFIAAQFLQGGISIGGLVVGIRINQRALLLKYGFP